ncbi:MAG: PLP-dependent aminotransferase family protein [Breznakibacter sp.]
MYVQLLSERIKNVPRSFIREILKTTISPDVISFAGGLPNGGLFPVEAFRRAADKAIRRHGASIFQYSNSEGYLPLRQFICQQYSENDGMTVDPANVLITNGSQQGLDLLAKVLINPGDGVLIEEPGYLGAIQSLAVMGASFVPVPLEADGANRNEFERQLATHRPKLFYTVPAYQNPSGVCYSDEAIAGLSSLIKGKNMLVVEDTPYRQITFGGDKPSSFHRYLPDQTVLLGSFSKTTVPGFRLGWMVAPDWLMDRLVVAKQASDLHTDIFSQMVLHQYLMDEDYRGHIAVICNAYGSQSRAMAVAIKQFFPVGASYVVPQGGMFFWLSLPDDKSSMDLFNAAIAQKVAFVPGVPFYTDGRRDCSTLRLNFTCSDEETIFEGIKRLGRLL